MSHGGTPDPGELLAPQVAGRVAETMQALATPSRLRILACLYRGPASVGEISEAVGMDGSAVSHQLRILRHLGLVTGERDVGNEAAAWVRLRAGHRLESPALVADGYHARTDGIVSLAVVASAILVALGTPIADPLIGMIVTVVILRITWHSYLTVRNEPGDPHAEDGHEHPSPMI